MKRIYLLIFFITALLLYSCSSRFNPRYYYNRNRNTASSGETPLADIDSFSVINIDPDKDPFKKGDWNSPNYNNFTLDLDNMVIEASFDGQNRPTYKLTKAGSWTIKDSSKNEYYYNGKNTSAAGYNMNNVKYYMYKSKNPTFDASSKYNQSYRLERFYFYKFYGEYMSVGAENYLIAIDKYSKLVFAFSIPTEWKNMLVRYAPKSWGAVELGWEAKYQYNNRLYFSLDGITYFYEYDPVGIVKSDGTIEMYQWCLNSISTNIYAPRFNGVVGDTNREIATYGKPGRSPYMPYTSPDKLTKDNIIITAKSLKNISVKSADGYLSWFTPKFDKITNHGYFTYGIGAVSYESDFPSDIEWLESFYQDGVKTLDSTFKLSGNDLKININDKKSFSKSKSYNLNNIKSKEVYIELASAVYKYNLLLNYVDTYNFGEDNSGSGIMATKDSPKVKLKYDSSKDAFVIDSGSIDKNDNISVSIIYDKSFTLKRGDKKDFTIKYNWKKGNDTVNGEEFEITYNLEFKSVS